MSEDVGSVFGAAEESGAEFCKKCKTELAAGKFHTRREKLAFTAALVLSAGSLLIHTGSVSVTFQTQNPALAKTVNSLSSELTGRECTVTERGSKTSEVTLVNAFTLLVECGVLCVNDGSVTLCEHVNRDYFDDRTASAFVRGAFLGSGSISLGKKYHLECSFGRKSIAEDFCEMLMGRGITARLAVRKTRAVVYVKDSVAISDVLALMGAARAVLSFNSIVAMRQMTEHINRQKNCDMHNIDKQVEASVRLRSRLADIDLDKLSAPLRDTARARIEYPDYSYEQLAELLGVSKSGLKNRLRKLERISEGKSEED